jgi:hypothetical protein
MVNDLIKNKWVGAGLLLVVLVGAWFMWGRSTDLAPLTDDGTAQVSQELLATLGKLHSITLDDSIFKDPAFATLTDFGVTIPSQPVGRRNPFEPIAGFSSVPAH